MKNKNMRILAIESSCDETSAAIVEINKSCEKLRQVAKSCNHSQPLLTICSNIVSSQVKLHAKYGGVYPELASREHVKNIIQIVADSCKKLQGVTTSCNLLQPIETIRNHIDYLAITTGPGLIGSLLVGVNTAKTLAYVFKKPIYAINHVEGHIYSNFVRTEQKNCSLVSQFLSFLVPKLPAVVLVVSGGHTSLVYMKNHLDYKVIGETLDDAAGEAFDKVSAMLGLGYPGGPVISALAEKTVIASEAKQSINSKIAASPRHGGTPRNDIHFPRPMINSNDFNFSFSGLKTSVLYTLKRLRSANQHLNQSTIQLICKEFQDAVVETLVTKTIRAAKKYKVKSVLLCGGVASNNQLRKMLHVTCYKLHVDFFVPEKSLCTDNAAMIGCAAAYKIALGKKPTPWYNVNADSNLQLDK